MNAWERGGATQADLVGFKMHWKLAPAQTEILRGAMELFLFRGGYGGLSLIEGWNRQSVPGCAAEDTAALLGGWDGLLKFDAMNEVPALAQRLHDGTPLLAEAAGDFADSLWPSRRPRRRHMARRRPGCGDSIVHRRRDVDCIAQRGSRSGDVS